MRLYYYMYITIAANPIWFAFIILYWRNQIPTLLINYLINKLLIKLIIRIVFRKKKRGNERK